MQQPGPDEITLWREILAGIVGVATGAVGFGYLSGQKSRDIDNHETRLKALEDVLARFAANCAGQHKEMLAEIRRETLAVVRQHDTEAQLKVAEQLYQLNITSTLTMRMQEEMSKDIEAIFARLNRRREDRPVADSRRADDPARPGGEVL